MTQSRQKISKDNEIYELLHFVIVDQSLNRNYGLQIEPEQNCSLNRSDEDFLRDLIVKEQATEVTPDTGEIQLDSISKLMVGTKIEFRIPQCLTVEDVDFMLSQKSAHSNLKWDNSRLGFNLGNENNWYTFSLPLLSKDKTKSIVMIRELCNGLCGHGWILLLTKQNGKWTSQKGERWIH
jgi:hypothetical protein